MVAQVRQHWDTLTLEARKRKSSVGKLVREAVAKAYAQDEELERRKKAIEHIKKIRRISKGKIDYKELINYGRRY